MKQFLTVIALVAMFASTSCNNAGNQTTTTSEGDTAAAPAVVEAPAFEPFKVIAVIHTVKDFDAWKKVYDENESMRVENGLSKMALGRDMDNPNKVYVVNKMADVQKAKDFAASPNLKESMQKGGVTGEPSIIYAEVVRFEETPAEYKGRMRVAHKVQDFDAWLKVFDAEGKETRASHGAIDRGISRNMDDPNMIYITFAISDMEKLKTRVNGPELKKIMADAGVISEPEVFFYTIVD